MAPETKSFFRKYWQTIVIGLSLQIIVGLVVGAGSIRIGLNQIQENVNDIKTLKRSNVELKMNQLYIATKEELDQSLPYKYSTGGGN